MRAKLARLGSVVLAFGLLAGCEATSPARPAPANSVGATMYRPPVSDPRAVAQVREDLDIYGRLEFSARFLGDGVQRIAPLNEGTFGQKLLNSLLRQVSTTSRNYALTVQPEVNDQKLGEMVLFGLQYEEAGPNGPRIVTVLNERLATSWWRIRRGESFRYTLSARASDRQDFHIAEKLVELNGFLSAVGAGPSLGASVLGSRIGAEVFTRVVGRIDETLKGMYSSEPSSTLASAVGPGTRPEGAPEGRFKRADRIVVRAADGSDLAEVSVRLVLASTMADPEASDDVPAPEAPFRPTPHLMPTLRVTLRDANVPVVLANHALTFPELLQLDREANARRPDPERFDTACRDANSFMQTAFGLTAADAMRVRWEVAERGFTQSPELQGAGCFQDEVPRLRRIGYPVDRALATARVWPEMLVRNDALDNLVKLMVGTGGSVEQVNGQLAPKVSVIAPAGALGTEAVTAVDDSAVDRSDVVARFLRGNATWAGCYSVPGANRGNINRLDRRLFFLPKDERQGPMSLVLVGSPLPDGGVGVVSITVNRAYEAQIQDLCKDAPETRDRLLAALRARDAAVTTAASR